MKIFVYTITLTLLLSCTGMAQERINMLSESQYEAITYNGKTIQQINNTNGNSSSIHQLFGSSSSVNTDEENRSKTFIYNGNEVFFRYKKGFVNGRVEAIVINNSSWPVVIKGKAIRVGDTEANLKQRFGSGLKVVNSLYGSGRFVAFNHSENDYDTINIEVDPSTKKVTEIRYSILP